MGLYDRQYTQDGYQGGFREGGPRMRMSMPPLTPVIKILLIINAVVFLLQTFGANGLITSWFSVWPRTLGMGAQVWRLVTYQFLHGGIGHILLNMLALYMFGSMLESHWSAKKFLWFYLGCGVVGGLSYMILLAVGILHPHEMYGVRPLVGASGSIMGILAATAILFPQIKVYVYGIFPVPIRVLAAIFFFISIFMIHGGAENAGGEAAHFGGMVAGAAYVFTQKYWDQWLYKFNHQRHHRRQAQQINLHDEVERILEKVHNSGLHSLSGKEKAILKKATEEEQKRNQR
jgi:membrane associated rhomboid family serine protease